MKNLLAFLAAFLSAAVLAQQSGVPSRGAGSGAAASTSVTSTYGTDFGPVHRCVVAETLTNTLAELGMTQNQITCNFANYTPVDQADGGVYWQAPHATCTATSALANSGTGWYGVNLSVTRGASTGVGGFSYWIRWALETNNGTTAAFAGVTGDATAGTGCASNPNAILNTIYMGCQGTTNWNICSNDATSTATCSDLGSGFPCATVPGFFDFIITAQPGASTVQYRIVNLITQATATGDISSDLPVNTAFMGWKVNACSGADAGAPKLGFSFACSTTR
jgi:hypothetical protein